MQALKFLGLSKAPLADSLLFSFISFLPLHRTQIEKPITAPINSFSKPKLVLLKDDRTVDFGNGEVGIWNYKSDGNSNKCMIEMEFDLKNDDSTYLLYQAKLTTGKYYPGVVKFGEEGKIYLVKGLPFRWNKKLIGTFTGSPMKLPRATVNMKP